MLNLEEINRYSPIELINKSIQAVKNGARWNRQLTDLIRYYLNDSHIGHLVLASMKELHAFCNESHHIHACYVKGMLYQYGFGCSQDSEKAQALFHNASLNNYGPAMVSYAFRLREKKCHLWAQIEDDRAIKFNEPHAFFNTARRYETGEGIAVNYESAINFYEKAIAHGDTDAMVNRAIMHQKGQGAPCNEPAAIDLYRKASGLGNTYAMTNLASILIRRGDPIFSVEAIRLLESAIKMGNSSAMVKRAQMYEAGVFGVVNYLAAKILYEKADALGHPMAIVHLSRLSLEGEVDTASPEIQSFGMR